MDTTGSPDPAEDPTPTVADDADLTAAAVTLVRDWLARVPAVETGPDRRAATRLHHLTADPASLRFTMAFTDRVARPESATVAAEPLHRLGAGPLPRFLSPLDRLQLRVGARLAPHLPGPVLALTRRRLRRLTAELIVDQRDPVLARHLARLRADGFAVNTNPLGEVVLGHREALRHQAATLALVARPDVTYVSVKASAVAAQLNLWAPADARRRVRDGLRPILRAAAATRPATFVNLDMEEYRDLRLTLDAFTGLLDEPEFAGLEAGIVLQAYLPEALAALKELTAWARRRIDHGGAPIKVRVVKGANLAMERVDAALHGWPQAPYPTKADTDANYKQLVDWACHPDHTAAVRLGVASHNLFDVAWAHLLADRRGVEGRVEFEMLHGMAMGPARVVREATGGLLLYTPVVDPADFDTALAYLFRRLEENGSGDNILRHLFDLADPAVFADQQRRFERAVATRHVVSTASRRRRPRVPGAPTPARGFVNAPHTDPTDDEARTRVLAAVAAWAPSPLPPPVAGDGVASLVAAARAAAPDWAARTDRAEVLARIGEELADRRPELVGVMVHEAAKTVAEADTEVSEAVDFARYYGRCGAELSDVDGARFAPLGVVAVLPPWNFPVAIALGGTLAALAAGNTVILKPAPETPQCAWAGAEACWAAGVPRDVLQVVRGDDEDLGTPLVGHVGVDGIILTGATETARRLREIAPDTALFAETSGKNALVVLPDADLDLAVADLVRSAFGHAGQKCSAASLAILVGSVATSARFRRQLVDATASLVVGPSPDPATTVGPLIGPPPAKLQRALTSLEPGQSWVLQPRPVDAAHHLWSPGIVAGVRPGSWFHRTECFGPVLGLMAAADLDEALTLQNGTGFGLTGGLHSLDPDHQRTWTDRVQVGNAYVNRAITGAIVQRQPFGGWNGSVVGPGAKAGGPHYVAQLGRWSDDGLPAVGAEPAAPVRAVLAGWSDRLDPAERTRLSVAARSDAHWWRVIFAREHDPTGLFCEANVLRYRPLPHLDVRVGPDAPAFAVARVLVALATVGIGATVSIDPGDRDPTVPGPDGARVEPAASFWARVIAAAPPRVRVVGHERPTGAVPIGTWVDDRPPLLSGRIELLRYVREQAVSTTRHRFRNVLDADADADADPVHGARSGR